MLQCANCPTYVCRVGDYEHGPENCPMHGDFPATDVLYADPEERNIARVAAVVESTGYRRWTRAEEIMEFAHSLGVSRLGLALCSGMRQEAETYREILEANGFEVVSGAEASGGIPEEESFSEGTSDGCDPVAQAQLFNQKKTGLNILFGMCVGHDSMFIRSSQALVTCLVAKDRALAHNSVAALYLADTFFQAALYQHHRDESQSLHSLEPESLQRLEQAYADPEIRRLAIAAAKVASFKQQRWSRVEETIELARSLKAKRLGVIFCLGLRAEAKVMASILESNGFEVISAGCKTGAVPKETIGILDSQKVQPGKTEIMCNPIAQAVMLNQNHTDLNILMGQCVGHDSLTIKYSEAPVTCLVVKDRVLAHNTIGAIYGAKGYFYQALYRDHRFA